MVGGGGCFQDHSFGLIGWVLFRGAPFRDRFLAGPVVRRRKHITLDTNI